MRLSWTNNSLVQFAFSLDFSKHTFHFYFYAPFHLFFQAYPFFFFSRKLLHPHPPLQHKKKLRPPISYIHLNDLARARAKCIGKCGFEIFCSKVGRNTTYKIKTCKPKYNYGKDFKNKNATSKWVSKVAVVSLRTKNDVKLA